MERGAIKVVFLPDNGDHPYQESLKRELAGLGVSVRPGLRCSLLPLLRSAVKYRPDFLHLHWLGPFLIGRNMAVSLAKSLLFLLELLLCRAAGIKLVWTLHNIANHEKVHYRLDLFFSGLTARLAHALIIHSRSHASLADEVYGAGAARRAAVVPYGVDLPAFGAEDAARARARLGCAHGDRVFLFYGNIRGYKGVPELLEAFGLVPGGGLKLFVAGRPYDAQLRAEIEGAASKDPRVRLRLEFLSEEESAPYFMAADAVVLPYREITTSGVLPLAMSYGRAVVAPALPFMTDVLGPEAGFLYDPADPDGLRSALAAASAADLAAPGRRAAARAAGFQWKDSAAKTLEVYRRVLAPGGR